ncbi:MAG: helix-turn-helix transcriptional regulator [Cyclobacteriaceae bacterium]|nr:helix-turn-helix transcriptional regulator [Cyclobacteriaceae bacterium]
MEETTLYIKNMVCDRCITAVRSELTSIGLTVNHIQLGEVRVTSEKEPDLNEVQSKLQAQGFELIDNQRSRIINKLKTTIIEEIRADQPHRKASENFSSFLEKELGTEYTHLSKTFSSLEGRTIEKYIIAQKIEYVKELLMYNELSLSEIAWKLNYSSVQYLSNQFKKETGLTPSNFKLLKDDKRKTLDKV